MISGNMNKKKIILTDCDGVICNWETGFDLFMNNKGHTRQPNTETEYSMSLRYGITSKNVLDYIKEYNESIAIASLNAYADSTKFVAKLAQEGFRFIAVTSISDHPDAYKNRVQNLKSLFGDIFDEVICLSIGASKYQVLMRWADSGYFWIEDHIEQASDGYNVGLKPILINHPYNSHYKTDLFPIVNHITPWEEIYEIVSKEYNKD